MIIMGDTYKGEMENCELLLLSFLHTIFMLIHNTYNDIFSEIGSSFDDCLIRVFRQGVMNVRFLGEYYPVIGNIP